jgi:hypothetical protein
MLYCPGEDESYRAKSLCVDQLEGGCHANETIGTNGA